VRLSLKNAISPGTKHHCPVTLVRHCWIRKTRPIAIDPGSHPRAKCFQEGLKAARTGAGSA